MSGVGGQKIGTNYVSFNVSSRHCVLCLLLISEFEMATNVGIFLQVLFELAMEIQFTSILDSFSCT